MKWLARAFAMFFEAVPGCNTVAGLMSVGKRLRSSGGIAIPAQAVDTSQGSSLTLNPYQE
jgi:hypothetical protein